MYFYLMCTLPLKYPMPYPFKAVAARPASTLEYYQPVRLYIFFQTRAGASVRFSSQALPHLVIRRGQLVHAVFAQRHRLAVF